MEVYYDTKIDQLVLVTYYPHSNLYIYRTNVLFSGTNKSPAKFKTLKYIGEYYSGDMYDQE